MLAARRARVMIEKCPSTIEGAGDPQERAQGKPGASRTRSLVRKLKNTRVSHHRYAEAIRPSLRNGFTAYFVLFLVTGLYCHHHQRDTQASSPT